MTIPNDCLQSYVDPWWEEDEGTSLRRGRLLWANLPHVMPEQATLQVVGRDEATDHTTAHYSIQKPLRIQDVRKASDLPVAGLPNIQGEVYLVQRAKVRPAIVLGDELTPLPRSLRQGETKRWTHPTVVVAPSYGTAPAGRATVNPELMKRFRRCEYPNYLCLWLPGTNEPSIIRLDQMQPISSHYQNYNLTKYHLSDEALEYLDDWLAWVFSGELPEGDLDALRDLLLDF